MKRGFTLIELMVSVGIFTIVMVVALGALLAIAESDRRAQTLKTITNNLNFAVESMSRNIRTGREYNCGSSAGGDCSQASGEPNGDTSLYFRAIDGNIWAYRWSTDCTPPNTTGCIQRSTNGGSTWEVITAPEVVVANCGSQITGTCTPGTAGLTFYLLGSTQGDIYQPRVIITIRGYVQVSAALRSNFNLQTTVTQRLYDQ